MIVVLDYGMGNLRSVEKAIDFLGYPCSVQPTLTGATKLVIPGVGAFAKAMEHLGPLADEIRAFARSGNPLLGICLGQQLLFDESEEMGRARGLGLLPGRVRYLPKTEGLKVPHMGWNALKVRDKIFLSGIDPGSQVYFVHSLYTDCEDPDCVAATTEYGIEFPAAVRRDNVWGTQFHPEKSGIIGLAILRNFLAW
ncbi:MAG: imidazole glycerol phosphate synthase subunit HisH [Fimbriimonadaceae bacterium]|nr:imidazole glycerol phosphate synthase subunit HisH [Fimbriimonadaceae bacterium]